MLNADGGTRTAAITAAFIAVADALSRQFGDQSRTILRDSIAAVSAGIVGGEPMLDLNYPEDSKADVDINVVRLGRGGLVEVQGTGEGGVFSRSSFRLFSTLPNPASNSSAGMQKEALGPAWPWTKLTD